MELSRNKVRESVRDHSLKINIVVGNWDIELGKCISNREEYNVLRYVRERDWLRHRDRKNAGTEQNG
jgi:hypothetical protein